MRVWSTFLTIPCAWIAELNQHLGYMRIIRNNRGGDDLAAAVDSDDHGVFVGEVPHFVLVAMQIGVQRCEQALGVLVAGRNLRMRATASSER